MPIPLLAAGFGTMGGAAGLGAAGQAGGGAQAAAKKPGMPGMDGGMGQGTMGGDAISQGVKGLTSLFGGLMDDARKRRLEQAQGMADAAGVEAAGVGGGANTQAQRQQSAFDSMMASFGQALGRR